MINCDMCCKGCAKRTAEPNCHETCAEYLAYRKALDELNRENRLRSTMAGWLDRKPTRRGRR